MRRSDSSIWTCLDLFGLGVHEHAGRRSVHAALRFGHRHPLHAVHAAFELEPRPHAVGRVALAPDRQRRVLVAAEVREGLVENRDGPAVPLGVSDVHPGQVGGEKRRLLATLTGLDLEHDVVGVVRVARCEQIGQLGVELFDAWPPARAPRRRKTRRRRPVREPPRGRRGQPRACGRSQRSATTWANRRPTLRAAEASACRLGSDSWRSRSACSASNASITGAVSDMPSSFPQRICRFVAKRKPTPGLRSRAESGVGKTASCRQPSRSPAPLRLPYRFSKRATRPPLSRIFCLPV